MSAGICIMNKQAIALAADSAVTVGEHVVFYNWANKLFSLSRCAPVGLILYANAVLMNVPVEIIVKQYKKQLGDRTFSKLQEYVDDFIKYIEEHSELFRFALNEKEYIIDLFSDLMIGLLRDYERIRKQKEESEGRILTQEEISEMGEQAVNMTLSFIDRMPKRTDYSFSAYVKREYAELFEQLIQDDSSLKWMNDAQIRKVCSKACELFDTDFERNGYVGIAIAGYGEQEIYPQMIHLHMSGSINGKLRYSVKERIEISEKISASIIPLAQTDVMQTFLFGINERFLSDLAQEIPKQINEAIHQVDDRCFTEGNKETVIRELKNVTGSILQHMTEIAGKNYMLPIVQSVSNLPIEELALLAESMINITSLRRKVVLDRNIGTVGGPVDVSVISKGEGFIWLKRKHYFDSKYNPQYFYSHFDKPERADIEDNGHDY